MDPSDPTGQHYNGRVRISESGKRCQKWGEDWPVAFRRFCRVVEGNDRPGCFVKSRPSGKRIFQNCNIPTCPLVVNGKERITLRKAILNVLETQNATITTSRNETILVVYNFLDRTPVLLESSGKMIHSLF